LPVTPGTQCVTVGGAIANDVHGKNHHRAGTFGMHVRSFELLRSDGDRIRCSPDENPDWYNSTIGGMGLTGVVTQAEIQLKRVGSSTMDQETIRFDGLDEFFSLSTESDDDYEHTVAWIDCLATGNNLGRGLFSRANHAVAPNRKIAGPPRVRLRFPIGSPVSLVNGVTVKLFNEIYFRKQWRRRSRSSLHYQRCLYPLDAISAWNRLYGKKGFLQYQCVVPHHCAKDAITGMLRRIAAERCGSLLTVLKVFGDRRSPGRMSFPRPGVTLAVDFPNRGPATLRLLDSLDEITIEAGGAVYPAKDARMSAGSFRRYFPEWEEFVPFVDPRLSSAFWRRVSGQSS